MQKLPKSFYTKNVLTVARELLGKIFVKKDNDVLFSGMIVETEAYDGEIDESAHSYGGKTKRNSIMFEEGGHFYVYFTYGMYHCCNVIAGKKDHGCGALIRAIEPIKGIDQMAMNRFGSTAITKKQIRNLTSGPGKICQAFDITLEHYGLCLLGDQVYILENERIPDKKVTQTTRIGIKKSVDFPWRFYIKDNPYVSKK